MEQATIIPTESRRRRFRAWDNIRRIFQRSSSKGSSPLGQQQQTEGHQRPRLLSVFTMPRSRSTSELQAMATTKVTPGTTSAPQPIPSSSSNSFGGGGGGGGGGVTNAVGKGSVGAATGLSVSQDSVFAFDEDSPGGSNYRGDHQQHQKRQQTQKQMMSELQKVIGSRTHRSADDDEGLPRSPVAIRHHLPSVTTSVGGRGGLNSSISSPVYGSGGGSDPSLISINSCELEEASCDSLHSRNPSSSKVLIQRPPTAPVEVAAATAAAAAAAAITDVQVDQVDGLLLMGMSSSSSASAVPLSHNAALHKRAVRPKKSHAPARHRQLPQLAPGSGGGGGMEFDIGIEDSFIVSTVVAVAERKKGGGGGGGERQLDNLLLKPPLPSSPIKQRSLSLGRAVDSVMVSQQPVVAGEEDESTATADAAAAGPSAAKVARSKSSVEKKFQHEVAGFWRRKEFNRLFKSGGGGSQSRDRSQENRSDGTTGGEGEREKEQQGPPSTGKRKDLRKIKKDKEEKRKRSDAAGRSESPSPPAAFLSRFFGSRRSGRSRNNNEAINNKSSGSGNNKTDTPASGPVSLPPPEPVQSTPPVPMPRSVFIHRSADHQEDGAAGEELEVNWTMPSPSSPPPSTVAAVGRTSVNSSGVVVVPADRWIETAAAADTTSYVRMPASSSSLVSPKLNRKEQAAVAVPPPSSPLPTRHHRIHIAGLSPYQRRVQRIGNGLQVTDDDEDDWDSPTDAPNTSYHFRRPAPAANRSVVQRTSPLQQQQQQQQQHDVTAAPESLPVNINHEFILKRASPPSASASDNIRRSLEVLKFSNEGLKKTIDSLNHHQEQKRRMSQSSDQLQLSDSCSNKRDESSAAASRSNSTSSLNISDVADDPAAIDTGLSSSIASLAHSAHSVDEKDVHDDVLIVDDHREKNEQYRWSPSPSVVPQVSGPSSPPPLDTDNNRGGAGPSSRAWENRQMAVPQQQHLQPMFSMSVRVQNPPPLHDERVQYKYKRSVSSPCNENEPKSLHCDIGRSSYQPSASSSRPSFISPSSSSSSSSSPPRPWQSKEEKERQNKWALISPSGAAIATDATSGDVGDESIKATPSLLMLMDMDLPPDVKLRPKKTSAAVSVTGGQQQQQETSELLKVFARRSLKVRDSQEIVLTVEDVVAAESLAVEPEVIQQGSIAPPPPQPPPPLDSPKKKKKPLARPPLTSIRSPSAVANESNLLIRLPPPSPHDPLAIVSKAERGSYSLTSPPHQQPFSEQQPSAHEDIIWKRLSQTKNYIQPPRPSPTTQQPHFINEKLPVKSSGHDQVHRTETKSSTPSTPATSVTTAATAAAAAAAPQGRQSKVLAMVHNIQRLQVT